MRHLSQFSGTTRWNFTKENDRVGNNFLPVKPFHLIYHPTDGATVKYYGSKALFHSPIYIFCIFHAIYYG